MALLEGKAHQLRMVVEAQLGQYIAEVGLHRAGAEVEVFADLSIRKALHHLPKHLGLGGSEG